ncbi:MAG TPA: sugar ABC transporter permease [Methylomirabilota bacterium]|nr:sugar ABC transporter permease [Methylomirabilota bacterium]
MEKRGVGIGLPGLGGALDRTFRYWALLPVFVVLLLLTAYPLVQLVGMSLSDYTFGGGSIVAHYSGLRNLELMGEDTVFRAAVRNTLVFVVGVVLVEFVLGFVVALLASGLPRGGGLFKTVLVIPLLVPPIAIGTMWRLMYQSEFGVINALLRELRLPTPNWLGDPAIALGSVMIVDVWHWTAFMFLILLAGLESLPAEPFEAARVDGASAWQAFRALTLPLMRPIILVALMLRTVFAFKVFDEVFLLTTGGPGTSTEVVSMYIYKVIFRTMELGYGSFLSVVAALLTSVFVLGYLWTLRRERIAA